MSSASNSGLVFTQAPAPLNPQDISDFVALYYATFNDADEREDPEEWIKRISRQPPSPQPVTHILQAFSAEGVLAGGVVFEYYRASRCGLITYLVVNPAFRRQGIGRRLIFNAIKILRQDAHNQNGDQLLAVFAETEDPTRFVSSFGPMPPRERVNAFARLGAKWLRFPYVQPSLTAGSSRVNHLLLLSFPLVDGEAVADFMDGRILRDFLHEFYRALGIAKPEKDNDFLDMQACLKIPVVLNDLKHFSLVEPVVETPALSLSMSSICLHLLEASAADQHQNAARAYQYCPITSSMELDLLSYAFRMPPACNSESISSTHRDIEIHFPTAYIYQTEGRVIEQQCAPEREVLQAKLGISRTRFGRSGRTIWHMAIMPAAGGYFTEYDIIKLIHLYDGKSEQTRLYQQIKFRLEEEQEAVSLDQLLMKITGCKPAVIKAGTIHILTGGHLLTGETAEDSPDTELLRMVKQSRESEGAEQHNKLLALMQQDGEERRVLKAYCGIVTGIFDFNEIDSEEVLDTLEPTFAESQSFIRIHRSTLVSISADDRALEALWDTVGASPYLFLPHAVLIHNESVVMDAEREIEKALASLEKTKPGIAGLFSKKRFGSLVDLERVQHYAERNLSHYLPNIFNYITEREMLRKGAEGRGLLERMASVQTKLEDLKNNINSIWHIRREVGQMLIALLLMLMSVLQVKGSFENELQHLSSSERMLLIGGTSLFCGAIILWLWLRGVRKGKASNSD